MMSPERLCIHPRLDLLEVIGLQIVTISSYVLDLPGDTMGAAMQMTMQMPIAAMHLVPFPEWIVAQHDLLPVNGDLGI